MTCNSLWSIDPGWDFPWVDVDGNDGVGQAMAHLLELGHRRIACVAWKESDVVGQHRLAGYQDGMATAGLPINSTRFWKNLSTAWPKRPPDTDTTY